MNTRSHRLALLVSLAFSFGAANGAPADDPPIKPRGLTPGDTIMFVAPAGNLDEQRVRLAVERLEAKGFKVVLPESLFRTRGYLAGTDEERADELMRAFTDPEVDAVFPGTGGYGATRILDLLDYETIAANPKMLIGFSDITALHLAIGEKCNLVTFHSPNPQWGLGSEDGMPEYAERHFWPRLLAAPSRPLAPYEYPASEKTGAFKPYAPGRGEGRLIGGNLSLVAALVGTEYQPDTRGRILFLEDVREAPYRVDRMLRQLLQGGMLDEPAAVILGQFHKCLSDPDSDDPGLSLDQVFKDYFEGAPYPVVGNFAAGHVPDNATLPFGCRFLVDGTTVKLLERGVESGPASDVISNAPWRRVFHGVAMKSVVLSTPRPLRLHAARIDLSAPGVAVCTNQDNGDRPEETDGLKTTSFALDRGCQLAVNGAPFWPVHESEGLPQNVVGLVVSDGELVSPVDEQKPRPALVFRGGIASVEAPPIALDGVDVAVGGFSCVLRGGEVVHDGSVALHPRTAAGVGDGGRTLYLAVIDGRQAGYSEGVTTTELGGLLKALGATEGINLDGGGTTAMAIADPADGPRVRLVNVPIHKGKRGNERVAASHLGVFATPLSDTTAP